MFASLVALTAAAAAKWLVAAKIVTAVGGGMIAIDKVIEKKKAAKED